MNEFPIDDDLELARRALVAADLVSLPAFLSGKFKTSNKKDNTPVTEIDLAVEKIVRSVISAARPTDSIYGEELSDSSWRTNPQPGRQWTIDPIDGTAGFARGIPVWATLISLLDDGVPVVGAVSAPAIGKSWIGAKGLGSWSWTSESETKRTLTVSGTRSLSDAVISYNSASQWIASGRQEALLQLATEAGVTRAFGDFWSYMLVAEGAIDMAGEPDLRPYDIAPVVPIIEEAGGRFSSLDGDHSVWEGTALATNGILHEEIIQLVSGGSS